MSIKHLNTYYPWRALSARAMKCIAALLVTFFLLNEDVYATHFRYGNVTWSYVSPNTVTFRITQAWRRSFAWNTTPQVGGLPVFTGNFFFGDGTQAPVNLNVTLVNLVEDRFYGEATITHTYSGPGPWTAYFGSCCRISQLQNNFDGNFRVETIVDLNVVNNSPIATLPPTINLPTGLAAATFTVPASDPDGDPLVFSLSSPTQMGDTTLIQPPGLSIDPATGVVTWSTIGRSVGELWNASVRISDGRGGIITLDFLIKIVPQSNPPQFDYAITPANGHEYFIQPGQTLVFNVNAFDIDSGDVVTLFGYGIPPGAGMLPALPLNGNPVQSTFSWVPGTADLGSRVINFIAQDTTGNQTSTSVVITVSMQPVFDSPPTLPDGSHFCIPSGVPFSTTIQAHSPDTLMTLQITSATIPATATLTPALPTPAANTTATQLDWTPAASDWGYNSFVFTATDAAGATVTTEFELVVNTQTVITSSPPLLTITEGQLFTYNITATDADTAYGDMIELLGINLPVWLSLSDNGDGTGTLSGTPPLGSAGSYAIQIAAEDIHHHCQSPAEQLFTINVLPACSVKTRIIASPAVVSTYCYGQSVTLTALGGGSYHWSTGDTTASINISAIGIVTYTVTVTSGPCSATASYLVLGAANIPPIAVCRNATVYLDSIGNARVRPSAVDGGSSSNCSGLTRTVTPNTFKCSDIGINTVTLTVTNATGLSSSCTAQVTVLDTTRPVAKCKNAAAYLSASGNATLMVADIDSGSYDNCSFTRSVSPSAFSCSNVGNNPVVLTVTDASGLSATCNAVVSIVDTIPLRARCRNTSVTLNSLGVASITAADVDGGSSDNCSFTRSVSPGSFSCSNIGPNNVTLTVTNSSGTSSCQAVVTVIGQTASCTATASPGTIYLGYGPQSTILSTNAIGALSYSWSPAAGLSCTNCSSPTFTPSAEGNYTFTVAVTNANGCVSSCSLTICVLDIRVPGSEGPKIYLCHVLTTNPFVGVTLAIPTTAASAHFPGHLDDRLGRCDQRCPGSAKTEDEEAESALTELNEMDIAIYPNPFNDQFTIKLLSPDAACTSVNVFDVTGKMVSQIACTPQMELTIDASSFAKGVYIAEVTQGDLVKRWRILKSD